MASPRVSAAGISKSCFLKKPWGGETNCCASLTTTCIFSLIISWVKINLVFFYMHYIFLRVFPNLLVHIIQGKKNLLVHSEMRRLSNFMTKVKHSRYQEQSSLAAHDLKFHPFLLNGTRNPEGYKHHPHSHLYI